MISKEYIGQTVTIIIDSQMGTKHPKLGYYFPINFGHIENSKIEALVIGVFKPIQKFTGKVIAILSENSESKAFLIVAPNGKTYTDEAILALTEFRNNIFDVKIIR
jgi:inorganic pyrophosphatase